MQAITCCENEGNLKTNMKDRKQCNERCKNWAEIMIKEGFSKEDCKNELLLIAEIEKEKIYNNPYESKEIVALFGFVAILYSLTIGFIEIIIPHNDIIWFVSIFIVLTLLAILIWLKISLPKKIRQKIDTKERIFNLEKAAEYIEKNIP